MGKLERYSEVVFVLPNIYLPKQLRYLRKPLKAREYRVVFDSLIRLSREGSQDAAAVLGYLFYLHMFSDFADPVEITTLCRRAAARGNAYAQFSLFCIIGGKGTSGNTSGTKWLHMSTQANFGAALHSFAIELVRVSKRPDLGKPYLLRGIRRLHAPCCAIFLKFAAMGKFGLMWQVLGCVLILPGALFFTAPFSIFFPFDEFTFFGLWGRRREALKAWFRGPSP